MSFGVSVNVGDDGNGYRVTSIAGVKFVFGKVPIMDMAALMKGMPKKAVTDIGLSRYAGAAAAMGLPADCERVRRERLVPIGQVVHHEYNMAKKLRLPDSACRWLIGFDRGTSSDTMFSHLAGFSVMQDGFVGDTPRDAGDFCRCRRLLEQVPEFAARIDELRSISPAWDRIVSQWDALCTLMDTEAPHWRDGKGKAPKTSDRLYEINGEGQEEPSE